MIVHLVDGTYELFRYFMSPAGAFERTAPEALRAVRGVVTSMLGMLEGGATHLGVATDHIIESFRNDLWAGYKTGEGIDPDLFAQFPLLEEMLEALGVVVWPMVEFEADDALAAAAAAASADSRVNRVYVCTPDNPTGRVLTLDDWRRLFDLSDRYGFVIAADECFSEIYFDESAPPLGALDAAARLGRSGFDRLVSFGSLSKRSNCPGLRSGYVAGDAALIKAFLLYRTYHGSAMSPAVAAASIAAWNDEAHVRANRALYAQKFAALAPRVDAVLTAPMPEAAFYLWANVGGDDADFARRLYADQAVSVLPGSYLGRTVGGVNPGAGYVRIALVAEFDECAEGIDRLVRFARSD